MVKNTKKHGILSIGRDSLPKHLEQINLWAAGIDVGATCHYVAVPEGCDNPNVREFKSFTNELYELADWLKRCGIKTIAMESTGTFWIPLYEILEEKGFEVKLVDARRVKNVSGRKTDVLDCQWLQQLHTYGLLNGAFRPSEDIVELRAYVRQRNMLIHQASIHIQHMQKALTQMNLKLQHVISDITGETGMKIIRSIVEGERDPRELAKHRNYRCKKSSKEIELSLTGNYREEHLFSLRQALELYETYQIKIVDCDAAIEKQLIIMKDRTVDNEIESGSHERRSKNGMSFELGKYLHQVTGVNLLEVPGINSLTALTLISEIGIDMSRWGSAKQFAAWLGLCPGNRVSGGKRLGGKSKPTANRASAALRLAANTLYKSQTALGAFLRRLKSRLGPAKAITATAHKIAKIIYNMLKHKISFKEAGQDHYEKEYRERVLRNLKKKAKDFGFDLVEKIQGAT